LGHVVSIDISVLEEFAVTGAEPDIEICAATAELPEGSVIRNDASAAGPTFRVDETTDGVGYDVSDIGRFWIDSGGRRVRYQLVPDASIGDVEAMLLGPVTGLALQMKGVTLMHAGGLSDGAKAFAVSGPHGAGKSTLVSSFSAASGLGVLSDDILPLIERDGRVFAGRSNPRMKLWDDSVAAIGLDATNLQPVFSGVSKRRVVAGTDLGRVAANEVPLAAFYILSPSNDANVSISIETIRGSAAVLALLAGMYSPITLQSGPRAKHAFVAATRISEQVPVRNITYHRSFENLPAIREAILSDVEVLTNA